MTVWQCLLYLYYTYALQFHSNMYTCIYTPLVYYANHIVYNLDGNFCVHTILNIYKFPKCIPPRSVPSRVLAIHIYIYIVRDASKEQVPIHLF